jgi:hypothetical protein
LLELQNWFTGGFTCWRLSGPVTSSPFHQAAR